MSEVSKNFKVGDKVKVVSLQAVDYRGACEGGIGDTGVIIDVHKYSVLKYCVESDEGDSWWWEEENLELVKEEETMFEQTPKSPYQEKGYTENSLFKFVGVGGEFEEGEIIKLHYDDGSDIPDFKSPKKLTNEDLLSITKSSLNENQALCRSFISEDRVVKVSGNPSCTLSLYL